MTQLLQDLRFALRLMAKKPALTVMAVVSLALGIGVNSSIFTLVNAVLLREPPIAQPDRVVEVYTSSSEGFPYGTSSVPDYFDYRDQSDVFAGLGAGRTYPVTYDDGEKTELLMGEMVSGNYFDVLGIRAHVGRTFLPEEGRTPGTHPVAVLGYDFWQRRFGGDPAVLGRTLKLNGQELTVVGVAAESFKGTLPVFSIEVWLPLMMSDQLSEKPFLDRRGSRTLMLKGRLKPEVSLGEAQAQLGTLARRLGSEYPETNEDREVTLVPIRDVILNPGFDGPALGVAGFLMAVVGLVLLIACSNIANLFLARASERQKEIAVRLALGAGRGRLVRQLLTESLLVAFLGGLLSLLVATWTARLIAGFRPPIPIPVAIDLGVDLKVLAFTLLLAVLTGVLCGLAPALQASRPDLVPALKDEGAELGRGYRRFGLRNFLVVGQVTVSTLLLIGAGLFIRSLLNAQSIDPGFKLRRGVAATLMPQLGGAYTDAEAEVLYRDLLERARAIPGVTSAAVAEFLPLGLAMSNKGVWIEGQELPEGEDPPAIDTMAIGPGYFRTLGIALQRGRDFTDRDDASAPGAVIVNETLARRFWSGEDPLGRRLFFDDAEDAPVYEVVGVAADGKYRTLGEEPRPYIYTAYAQTGDFMLTLILAAAGGPRAEGETLGSMRRLLNEVDPHLTIFEIKTLTEHLDIMLFAPRMGAALLAAMGLLGLILASVGLYGVVAFSVARRTREIGVRMALGAGKGDVLAMVVREGMVLVAVGVVLGVAVALAATRALQGFLYGIAASDPTTYVAVPLFLLAVAWLANFLPARRATGIDPIHALRYE